MSTQKNVRMIKKNQWLLGFLGFLGMMGFTFDPSFLLFFSFFGFFSWYWDYKVQQGGEDERLIENNLKATNLAFRVSLSFIYIGAVLENNLLEMIIPPLKQTANKHLFLLILIAFGFAIGIILRSYLTYHYDTKE